MLSAGTKRQQRQQDGRQFKMAVVQSFRVISECRRCAIPTEGNSYRNVLTDLSSGIFILNRLVIAFSVFTYINLLFITYTYIQLKDVKQQQSQVE